MNRPYYEEIGIEPSYTNDHLFEQVYDDRELEEDEPGLDWSFLRQALQPEEQFE